jgi:hypothetical protein
MADYDGPCEICDSQAEYNTVPPNWPMRRTCPRCGEFEYDEPLPPRPKPSPDGKARLSGWVREQNAAGLVPVRITGENAVQIMQMQLPGLVDRANHVLSVIARDRLRKPDDWFVPETLQRDPELQGVSYSRDPEAAGWRAHAGRADPIGILHAADANRQKELVPLRYGRMLQSPFTFYRGSVGVMAADLAETPATGLHVQVCGDAHLMNFGGFATPERRLIFDINDLDETLPAPWEWDVKRLVASFVLAARANGLSDADGRDAAVACARSYRRKMRDFAAMDVLDIWYARLDDSDFLAMLPADRKAVARKRIAKATAASSSELVFPKLVEQAGGQPHIRDTPPTIFHAEASRAAGDMEMCRETLAKYRETLADDRRVLFDRYRLVDAAIKVVGIGSVGTLCAVALMMSIADHPFFLQIKQANASVLEAYAGKERLCPAWRTRGPGPAADAAGIRFVSRLGHRSRGPACLHPPAARREAVAGGRDLRCRDAVDLWQGVRLGIGARPRQGRRPVDDQRLPRQWRPVRRRDGQVRARLCRPGRKGPRCAEGRGARRHRRGADGALNDGLPAA